MGGRTVPVCKRCSPRRFQRKPHVKEKGYKPKPTVKRRTLAEEPEYTLIDGYGRLIKTAREKLHLKREDLAAKLGIKRSHLENIELERIKPSINLAKKFERLLNIQILEKIEEEPVVLTSSSVSGTSLTLGEVLKLKKRGKK